MILNAVQKAENTVTINTAAEHEPPRLFLHVPYHPRDPASNTIQKTFRDVLLQPDKETPLWLLRRNHERGYLNVHRMTIAYHRPFNLKNLLSPRKFRQQTNVPVSSFTTDNPEPMTHPHDNSLVTKQSQLNHAGY